MYLNLPADVNLNDTLFNKASFSPRLTLVSLVLDAQSCKMSIYINFTTSIYINVDCTQR